MCAGDLPYPLCPPIFATFHNKDNKEKGPQLVDYVPLCECSVSSAVGLWRSKTFTISKYYYSGAFSYTQIADAPYISAPTPSVITVL